MKTVKIPHLGSRLPALLLSFCAILLMLGSVRAGAVDVDGGFTVERKYSYGSGYTTTLTGYTGSSADVVLPTTATINGTEYAITAINSSVFQNNSGIRSVVIGESYTSLPTDCFSGCDALERVTIPKSVTAISSSAFEGCTALTDVSFTAGGTSGLSIMNAAFAGCTALEQIEFPARLSSFMNDSNVLFGCTSLETITVADGCTGFLSDDGLLYKMNDDGATAMLVAYPFGKDDAELTIPATAGDLTVTGIGGHMFRDNTTLTKVTVPADVTEFKLYSFNGCAQLKEVDLGCETAPTLGSSAFVGLASDSVIKVANETVADAFAAPDSWTHYYTEGTTTVQIKTAPAETVSATLSLEAGSELTEEGAVQYHLYLDDACHVNTLTLRLTFDATQLEEGALSAVSEQFGGNYVLWTVSGNVMTADIMLNHMGNDTGVSSDEQMEIATVTLPVKSGVTGEITATLSDLTVSGIPDVEGAAVAGTVTASHASAVYFIANFDVNGDGAVDQVDITEAQRYYMAKSTDADWGEAKKADVNHDGVVDLEDLIALFHVMLAN